MDPLIQVLYGIPVIGLVFQFVGYLIAVLRVIAPIILQAVDADRLRGAVRRDVRALRRGQHRHRGDHARGGVHRLVRRRPRRPESPARPGAVFGATPALLIGAVARALRPASSISLLHAWLSISVRADQIISGTIINIAAPSA